MFSFFKRKEVHPDKNEIKGTNAFFEMGFSAYKANNYDKAIDYFNLAVKSGLNDAASFVEIGVCVINITGGRNPHMGEGYFMRAIEIDKTYAMAYYNLGTGKLIVDEFKQAIIYFDKAIEYQMPNISFAYFSRASARLEKTIKEQRLNVFDSLSKYIMPDAIKQSYLLCYSDIMKAMEITKANDADILFVAGRICEKLDRVTEAMLDYTLAAGLGDNDAKTALHRIRDSYPNLF